MTSTRDIAGDHKEMLPRNAYLEMIISEPDRIITGMLKGQIDGVEISTEQLYRSLCVMCLVQRANSPKSRIAIAFAMHYIRGGDTFPSLMYVRLRAEIALPSFAIPIFINEHALKDAYTSLPELHTEMSYEDIIYYLRLFNAVLETDDHKNYDTALEEEEKSIYNVH